MTSTFLDTLPREIRDQIYGYVLSPHSRTVYLTENLASQIESDAYIDEYSVSGRAPYKIRSKSNGEYISLSFLRTCRQIYHEAKVLFWERNSIELHDILPEAYNTNRILRSLQSSMGLNATSVELKIDILKSPAFCKTKRDNSVSFEYQLRDLAKWPNLKRIRLHMSLGGDGWDNFNGYGHTGLAKLLYYRYSTSDWWSNLLRSNIEALKEAGGKDGYLSHVKRELEIDTGYPQPNRNGFPQRMLKMYSGTPMNAFSELNEAWFGSLSLDGRLCFQEGREIDNMFIQQPEPRLPTLKHFFFFKYDIECWINGQCGSFPCVKAWPAGDKGKLARKLAWEESGRAGCDFDLMREIHWPWNQISPPEFVP